MNSVLTKSALTTLVMVIAALVVYDKWVKGRI